VGGGLSRHRGGSRGSVLLDVLVALLIASSALLFALGGIVLAARASRRAGERTLELVASRNEQVRSRRYAFVESLPAR
jgi:hypothetical protein